MVSAPGRASVATIAAMSLAAESSRLRAKRVSDRGLYIFADIQHTTQHSIAIFVLDVRRLVLCRALTQHQFHYVKSPHWCLDWCY
jgi:hypothetical protein